MVEFGTFSAFRGWVRVRVLGYGFGVRGRKVKSRDCALASDLVRAKKNIEQTFKPRAGYKICSRNVAIFDKVKERGSTWSVKCSGF